jgi:outer membrane lipoprotein-sorting protein
MAWTAFSQGKALTENEIVHLRQGVAKSAENIRTIASDFVQDKEMSVLSEKIISRGKFYLRDGTHLRWEYTQPFSYIIVISGYRVTIAEDDRIRDFDTRSNRVFAEINRIITGSVQGTLLNDKESFHAIYAKNADHYIVTLSPLLSRLRESLDEIIIYFDMNDFTVDQLDMVEPGGDLTRIRFLNKEINQPLPDEKFILH